MGRVPSFHRLALRMKPITFTPIGTIHSPFTELEGMPIQPAGE